MSLVSVIMPLFNANDTIENSVMSVLTQSYEEIELIIVDDQSSDNSFQIATDLASTDKRIKLLQNNVNSGAGITRNKAIAQAKGDYIAFLDADDLWYPNKLATQISTVMDLNVPLVCSGYDIVDFNYTNLGSKQPSEWLTYQDLLKSNHIGCLTALYSVKTLGKQFMPDLRKRQDYALWLNITKAYGAAYCIQRPLAQYYIQPGSISSNKFEMLLWNYKMFKTSQGFSPLQAAYLTFRNAYYKISKG